jgi:hypothetical protein
VSGDLFALLVSVLIFFILPFSLLFISSCTFLPFWFLHGIIGEMRYGIFGYNCMYVLCSLGVALEKRLGLG